MRANQLLFYGHAFPSVSATKTDGVVNLVVSDRSKGRFWAADKPRGFWRTFAETDPGSINEVTTFFNRYGDPDDIMPRPGDGTSDTSRWPRHIERFALAARAWDPPDNDGISRLTGDRERLEAARWFLNPGERPAAYMARSMARPGEMAPAIEDVFLSRSPNGDPVLRPFTLLAYMELSAVLMVQVGTPMARCAHCSHWYGVTDIRTRFCSGACKNAAQRLKKDV